MLSLDGVRGGDNSYRRISHPSTRKRLREFLKITAAAVAGQRVAARSFREVVWLKERLATEMRVLGAF